MAVLDLFEAGLATEFTQSADYSLHPQSAPITAVIAPQTPAQLQKAIATASQHQIPLITLNSLHWGGLVKFPQPGIALDLSGLDQLVEHAVGDLTVTCGAGMKFRNLQATLAQAGQFLAIDPLLSDRLTIGEIIDTANTGSLRQRYGGIRDMLLGIAFVRADGELVKAGGRVVKNVAGYDLMKLLTGAYGSLGIICQATFRLYPLPLCDRTVVVRGAKLEQLRAELLLSSLTPIACDLWAAPELPFIQLVIRFGGSELGVATQITRLEAMAVNLGLEVKIFPHGQIWADFCHGNQPLICKIGTLPDRAYATVQEIQAIGAIQIHAASGLGIVSLDAGELIPKIRRILTQNSGFLTVLKAPPGCKANLWGGNASKIMSAIKHKFDPHNLLNPEILPWI